MKTIKNYFKKVWLFKSFEQMVEDEKKRINKLSTAKQHEQLLIETVIKLLKTEPENFSAKWSSGDILDHSVKHKNSRILIFENGHITHPISLEQTKQQTKEIFELIKPIFERDSKIIVDKLLNK